MGGVPPHYITFVALLASAGIRSTSTVMVLPLEHDFGWDRATVSVALSVNLLLYGLCGPFAGALMARFGVRRVMLVGLATLALATGLSVFMSQLWQMVGLWGVFVGLGSGSMALVLGATVATRWFVKRRGLITGIFAASTATGQLIFLPQQAAIVESAGWRVAVLIVSVVAIAAAALVALFMRDDPRDIGLLPYGAVAAAESEPAGAVEAVHANGNPFALAVDTLLQSARVKGFWRSTGGHWLPLSVEPRPSV